MINFPKKKGRKSKKELEQIACLKMEKELLDDNTLSNKEKEIKILELKNNFLLSNEPDVKKIPKKRGRKPKGGKIIKIENNNNIHTFTKPNIILHLKCNKLDIDKMFENNFDSYKFNDQKFELKYENINNQIINNQLFEKNIIQNQDIENNNIESKQIDYQFNNDHKYLENKNINKKLDNLIRNFHTNNISDKKTACFWCTCDFCNPTVYIPKNYINKNYNVYGCFCSPECACAFLMNENLDNSIKFERFYLLNNIYCKIYNYEKNIKPAPSPFYLLDKFMGTLTIQEYRKLLYNERLLIVIDKPLTPVLPELFFENDDFILNSRSIPTSI